MCSMPSMTKRPLWDHQASFRLGSCGAASSTTRSFDAGAAVRLSSELGTLGALARTAVDGFADARRAPLAVERTSPRAGAAPPDPWRTTAALAGPGTVASHVVAPLSNAVCHVGCEKSKTLWTLSASSLDRYT